MSYIVSPRRVLVIQLFDIKRSEYEMDNRVRHKRDYQANHRIEDSVLCTRKARLVAARGNIAEAANNNHNYGNRADQKDKHIGKLLDGTSNCTAISARTRTTVRCFRVGLPRTT